VPAIDLMFGAGSFVDARTVRVTLNAGGERLLAADRIVINTGGRPVVPNVPGLADVNWLDSSSVMELQILPAHLVILGGGYIGLEFSQMFRASARTVITRRPADSARDPDVPPRSRRFSRGRHDIVKNANTLRVGHAA
jgi:pyruvate/2-oxoglutarate dehydrogenase complex dihydrolipoamide dehydrogenase (E3) component